MPLQTIEEHLTPLETTRFNDPQLKIFLAHELYITPTILIKRAELRFYQDRLYWIKLDQDLSDLIRYRDGAPSYYHEGVWALHPTFKGYYNYQETRWYPDSTTLLQTWTAIKYPNLNWTLLYNKEIDKLANSIIHQQELDFPKQKIINRSIGF
jgi:hypothetical protein